MGRILEGGRKDGNGNGALKFFDITRGLGECICNEVSMFGDKVFAAAIRRPAVEIEPMSALNEVACASASSQMMAVLASDMALEGAAFGLIIAWLPLKFQLNIASIELELFGLPAEPRSDSGCVPLASEVLIVLVSGPQATSASTDFISIRR